MESHKQTLGRWGEDVALPHVIKLGWEVLSRNWRVGRMEVDLVVRDGPWLILVEVKTRTEPVQASWHRIVSKAQQERLIRAARVYLARLPERHLEVRFDVIAVLKNRHGHRVLHTEQAFYPLLPGR
jgi:putative endonuclease